MRRSQAIVVIVLCVFAVCVAALGSSLASPADPPPQSSHTLIQNMSSEVASVSVEFYDPDGTLRHTVPFTLAGNGARTIHASDYAQLGASWRGSQVVASSQPIVATVVNYGSPSAHNIYEGFDSSQADTQLFMPSIHWNPLGQWSTIAIQNVYTETAEVEITYYDRSGNAVVGPITATIAPGAAEFRDASTDCAACGEPPVGSVRVICTNGKLIAGVVMESLFDATYSYGAFSPADADTTILLPSVHRSTWTSDPSVGQFSHILVQNTSETTAADVTITYYKQDGSLANQFSKTIAAKGSYTFHTTDEVPAEEPTNLEQVGSAVVTSSGPPIVATVVETLAFRPYSYNGCNSTAPATTILLPSVHRSTWTSDPSVGQFSHILVQNTSETTAADVTITYYKQDGNLANQFSKTIAAKGSYTFHTTDEVPAEEPTNLEQVGSAVVESSGPEIVAVVVETLAWVPGVYSGFPQ